MCPPVVHPNTLTELLQMLNSLRPASLNLSIDTNTMREHCMKIMSQAGLTMPIPPSQMRVPTGFYPQGPAVPLLDPTEKGYQFGMIPEDVSREKVSPKPDDVPKISQQSDVSQANDVPPLGSVPQISKPDDLQIKTAEETSEKTEKEKTGGEADRQEKSKEPSEINKTKEESSEDREDKKDEKRSENIESSQKVKVDETPVTEAPVPISDEVTTNVSSVSISIPGVTESLATSSSYQQSSVTELEKLALSSHDSQTRVIPPVISMPYALPPPGIPPIPGLARHNVPLSLPTSTPNIWNVAQQVGASSQMGPRLPFMPVNFPPTDVNRAPFSSALHNLSRPPVDPSMMSPVSSNSGMFASSQLPVVPGPRQNKSPIIPPQLPLIPQPPASETEPVTTSQDASMDILSQAFLQSGLSTLSETASTVGPMTTTDDLTKTNTSVPYSQSIADGRMSEQRSPGWPRPQVSYSQPSQQTQIPPATSSETSTASEVDSMTPEAVAQILSMIANSGSQPNQAPQQPPPQRMVPPSSGYSPGRMAGDRFHTPMPQGGLPHSPWNMPPPPTHTTPSPRHPSLGRTSAFPKPEVKKDDNPSTVSFPNIVDALLTDNVLKMQDHAPSVPTTVPYPHGMPPIPYGLPPLDPDRKKRRRNRKKSEMSDGVPPVMDSIQPSPGLPQQVNPYMCAMEQNAPRQTQTPDLPPISSMLFTSMANPLDGEKSGGLPSMSKFLSTPAGQMEAAHKWSDVSTFPKEAMENQGGMTMQQPVVGGPSLHRDSFACIQCNKEFPTVAERRRHQEWMCPKRRMSLPEMLNVPNVPGTPGVPGQPYKKPRRRRRTRAEMEAARAAGEKPGRPQFRKPKIPAPHVPESVISMPPPPVEPPIVTEFPDYPDDLPPEVRARQWRPPGMAQPVQRSQSLDETAVSVAPVHPPLPKKPKAYKCYFCNGFFDSRHHLNKHREKCKIETKLSNPYVCSYCGMEFPSMPSLNGHLLSKHRGGLAEGTPSLLCQRINIKDILIFKVIKFICSCCINLFDNMQLWENHKKDCLPEAQCERYYEFKCMFCNVAFESRNRAYTHCKSRCDLYKQHIHEEEKNAWRCKLCKVVFGSVNDLNGHLLTKHTKFGKDGPGVSLDNKMVGASDESAAAVQSIAAPGISPGATPQQDCPEMDLATVNIITTPGVDGEVILHAEEADYDPDVTAAHVDDIVANVASGKIAEEPILTETIITMEDNMLDSPYVHLSADGTQKVISMNHDINSNRLPEAGGLKTIPHPLPQVPGMPTDAERVRVEAMELDPNSYMYKCSRCQLTFLTESMKNQHEKYNCFVPYTSPYDTPETTELVAQSTAEQSYPVVVTQPHLGHSELGHEDVGQVDPAHVDLVVEVEGADQMSQAELGEVIKAVEEMTRANAESNNNNNSETDSAPESTQEVYLEVRQEGDKNGEGSTYYVSTQRGSDIAVQYVEQEVTKEEAKPESQAVLEIVPNSDVSTESNTDQPVVTELMSQEGQHILPEAEGTAVSETPISEGTPAAVPVTVSEMNQPTQEGTDSIDKTKQEIPTTVDQPKPDTIPDGEEVTKGAADGQSVTSNQVVTGNQAVTSSEVVTSGEVVTHTDTCTIEDVSLKVQKPVEEDTLNVRLEHLIETHMKNTSVITTKDVQCADKQQENRQSRAGVSETESTNYIQNTDNRNENIPSDSKVAVEQGAEKSMIEDTREGLFENRQEKLIAGDIKRDEVVGNNGASDAKQPASLYSDNLELDKQHQLAVMSVLQGMLDKLDDKKVVFEEIGKPASEETEVETVKKTDNPDLKNEEESVKIKTDETSNNKADPSDDFKSNNKTEIGHTSDASKSEISSPRTELSSSRTDDPHSQSGSVNDASNNKEQSIKDTQQNQLESNSDTVQNKVEINTAKKPKSGWFMLPVSGVRPTYMHEACPKKQHQSDNVKSETLEVKQDEICNIKTEEISDSSETGNVKPAEIRNVNATDVIDVKQAEIIDVNQHEINTDHEQQINAEYSPIKENISMQTQSMQMDVNHVNKETNDKPEVNGVTNDSLEVNRMTSDNLEVPEISNIKTATDEAISVKDENNLHTYHSEIHVPPVITTHLSPVSPTSVVAGGTPVVETPLSPVGPAIRTDGTTLSCVRLGPTVVHFTKTSPVKTTRERKPRISKDAALVKIIQAEDEVDDACRLAGYQRIKSPPHTAGTGRIIPSIKPSNTPVVRAKARRGRPASGFATRPGTLRSDAMLSVNTDSELICRHCDFPRVFSKRFSLLCHMKWVHRIDADPTNTQSSGPISPSFVTTEEDLSDSELSAALRVAGELLSSKKLTVKLERLDTEDWDETTAAKRLRLDDAEYTKLKPPKRPVPVSPPGIECDNNNVKNFIAPSTSCENTANSETSVTNVNKPVYSTCGSDNVSIQEPVPGVTAVQAIQAVPGTSASHGSHSRLLKEDKVGHAPSTVEPHMQKYLSRIAKVEPHYTRHSKQEIITLSKSKNNAKSKSHGAKSLNSSNMYSVAKLGTQAKTKSTNNGKSNVSSTHKMSQDKGLLPLQTVKKRLSISPKRSITRTKLSVKELTKRRISAKKEERAAAQQDLPKVKDIPKVRDTQVKVKDSQAPNGLVNKGRKQTKGQNKSSSTVGGSKGRGE